MEYGDVFRVDSATGEVFLRRRLDREEQSVYRLTVTASDFGSPPLSAVSQLTVTVADVNDNPPRIEVSSASRDQHLRVVENSEPLAFVAYVSASDRDVGSAGMVDCYVEGSQFRLEPLYDGAESEYKLLTATTFDRELQSSIVVTLTCSDRGQPRPRSTRAQLVVELSDANDHSPLIASQNYEADVSEGNEIGSEIVHINATDADTGHNSELRYAMTPVGDTPDHLSIDEKTGSVNADVSFDYESWRTYEYIVRVTDAGDVPRTSTASLTVRVVDADDERPQFDRSAYYFTVLEDAPIGSVVGRVSAADRDITPAFSTVSYHIQNNPAPFNIDLHSGELHTAQRLDREQWPVYELTVIARDTSGVDVTIPVTVNVEDVNDNSPVIISPQPPVNHSTSVITVSSQLPAGSLLTRYLRHIMVDFSTLYEQRFVS